MEEWISNNPIIFSFLLALAGGLVAAGIWIGSVNEFKSGTKKILETIQEDIKKILGRISPTYAEGKSPLNLNDLGKKISKEIDAERWAEDLLPEVKPLGEGKNPYQIQEICQRFVDGLDFDEGQTTKLQDSAYNNGLHTVDIIGVLALVLRDKLIQSLLPE